VVTLYNEDASLDAGSPAYESDILKEERTVNSQRDEAAAAKLVTIGRPSFDSRFECW
jgi:hypothetical protein